MDAAVNAALLAGALAWRAAVGRIVRAWAERFTSTRVPIEHPALDLLIGLLAGWTAFAIWSTLLKRALGTAAPLFAFVLVELLVIGWLGVREAAAARASGRRLVPGRQALLQLAAVVVLLAALAPRAAFTFDSENTDQDQHIAWAVETAHQGVVPDHYEETDAALDYPLGFHALATSVSAGIVSPAIVINALPLLTSILVVALICAAVRAIAMGGGEVSPAAAALEAGCALALALALFSGHFSVWPRYLVTPRQIAGLCHLVPLIVWTWALAQPSRAADASWRRSVLPIGALVGAGALTAAVNPTLVPLQAILSALALATAALRRRVSWAGLGWGLAAGAMLALVVIAADPYLARRANLPGLHPAPAPYLGDLQADFSRNYTGRTCLTAACVAGAATSSAALSHAAEPWATLTAGAVELLHRPPAPLRYDQPAPGRHRFPDLTGVGLAPVHGRVAPYLLAILPVCFVAAVWSTRNGRLAWAGTGLVVAIAVDGLLRGVLTALVRPDDPGLRLLPYYADVASAVLFTQLLWPLLLVGALFAGWAGDSTRRRQLRLGVAAVVLVALAVSAAGGVKAGMAWTRVLDAPGRADVAALGRLEQRLVPAGESFLVAGEEPAPRGERWIFPADDAVLWYLHARRPTLFLYFLDHTARHGALGLEHTCATLQAGGGDTLVRRYRARWALSPGPESRAVETVGRRLFCGRRMAEWFPAMRAAGSDGRLTIVELWRDPR